MAKTNKVVTDISGKEVTHYGCATIQDACELGGVLAPSNSNKLITIEDVLDKHPYNVGLIDNLHVEYSENGLVVAYDDLRVQDWIELPMGNESLKVGVLRLNASMEASMLTGGTSDNGYLIDSNSSTQVRQCIIDTDNSSLIPGYIRLLLSDISSNYISDTRKGYEIVLQNFLSNLYDESSLEIKSITLKDNVNSTDVTSGSDYSTNPDASEFNISNSQKRIVVENGQQKICGMIKPQAADSKYTQYTNFDANTHLTLSLMLISTESNSITLNSSDMLYSTIEVEFKYLANDEEIGAVPAMSKLSIDLWFRNNLNYIVPEFVELEKDTGELPEVEDNESGETVTIDPSRTILYTTSNESTIANYTDAKAAEFAGGVAVENAGYATLSSGKLCGYILYVETPTTIGKNKLFLANKLVTTVTLPDGILHIYDGAFRGCSNLESVKLPLNLSVIGYSAFSESGIRYLNISNAYPDNYGWYVRIQNYAFLYCPNLVSVSGNSWLDLKNEVFIGCEKLLVVTNRIAYAGKRCFEYCKKLISDVPAQMYGTTSDDYYTVRLTEYLFAYCSSLLSVTLHVPSFIRDAPDVDGGLNMREPYAFYECSGLKTIYIAPKSTIDYDKWGFVSNTFEGCTNVKKIYCNSESPPFLGIKNIDKNCAIDPNNCDLYIPTGRTAAYNSKAQWGKFALDHIHELTPEEFHEIRPDIW